jgi:hypothetical protein
MPEISRFFGVVIGMFYSDHPPPHFHAVRGEYDMIVEIESSIPRGELPPRTRALVLEWALLHRLELLENWGRA